MSKANEQLIESMILSWIRQAEQNGALKQNSYSGKKLNPGGGCSVHTNTRLSAISTLSSAQTSYPASGRLKKA